MAHYRIYGLTEMGHLAWAFDAVCPNDADACAVARAAEQPEREREVWCGTTRVALLLGDCSIIDGAVRLRPAQPRWAN